MRRISPPVAWAIAAWIAGATLIRWILYGPHVDLSAVTGLPLGFVLNDWLSALRHLLSAPLGA